MFEDTIFSDENVELVIKYLYTVQGYCTFNIKVRSGEFSGSSNFCISIKNLNLIIDVLLNMHSSLAGICEIQDNDSDAYIKLEMQKHGHILLCGQIGGSHEDQYMRFKCTVDQTLLIYLIKKFKNIRNDNHK